MKIIVTGAAGFIGSNLCKYLLKMNFNVIGIDNFVCGYEENLLDFKDMHPSISFDNISDSFLMRCNMGLAYVK